MDVSSDYKISENLQAMVNARQQLFIGGKWVDAIDGQTFNTVNPATGEVLASVARAGPADIDKSVRAARAALNNPAWSKMTPIDRTNLLLRLADLIERDAQDLAVLECLDNGKPATMTRFVEVEGSIKAFRYFAGWPTKFGGETIPVSPKGGGEMLNYTTREPVGVVGSIIPWNFPMSMAAWKIAPAVAAGCTVILKPAEQTPLTALRLGKLIEEAGFPPGVVNIVPGMGDAGAAMSSHPGIDKIAFTGSTEVGKKIIQASAGNLKKVTLELGGKSPNIILPDADIQAAAGAAAQAIFFNQGQVCTAGSRLYVHTSIFDETMDAITNIAQGMKIGNGLDPNVALGPLVSAEQHDTVSSYVDIGREEGGNILTGGKRPSGLNENGFFYEPTIFVDTGEEARICKEEIFGPVLTAMPWSDMDELVKKANDSVYGLAAGVWTNNLKQAHHLAKNLQAGTVWINCYNQIDPASPFGGMKQSGWGREHGRQVMEQYSEVKSVWINTP